MAFCLPKEAPFRTEMLLSYLFFLSSCSVLCRAPIRNASCECELSFENLLEWMNSLWCALFSSIPYSKTSMWIFLSLFLSIPLQQVCVFSQSYSFDIFINVFCSMPNRHQALAPSCVCVLSWNMTQAKFISKFVHIVSNGCVFIKFK